MDVTLTHQDEARPARRGQGSASFLLLTLESNRPTVPSAALALHGVDEVHIGRGATRAWSPAGPSSPRRAELIVPDGWMSTHHVRLLRCGQGWQVEDLCSKNGTFVNSARVDTAALQDGDLLEVGSSYFYLRRADPDVYARPPQQSPVGLRTLCPSLARELGDLLRVAASRAPIILRGETGTGKEVVARATHQRSGRTGPLRAVNCGAISPTLIESELFGHRKGAFSGADTEHEGLLRSAHQGTLFLDEVAELPLEAQVKLLRALQEQEVLPVGETRPVPVDLRVVCATHQDLGALVTAGSFRHDLYARLAGFSLQLPPLRARREDLGLLIATLLEKIVGEAAAAVRFKRAAARALFCHDWPSNIRELEQTLTSALALAGEEEIGLEHLPAELRASAERAPTSSFHAGEDEGSTSSSEDSADAALRRQLRTSLEAHQGNVSAVAREMDKARVQIRRWCKRFGLDPDSFRGARS